MFRLGSGGAAVLALHERSPLTRPPPDTPDVRISRIRRYQSFIEKGYETWSRRALRHETP